MPGDTYNILLTAVGDNDPVHYKTFKPDDADKFNEDLKFSMGPILESLALYKMQRVEFDEVWLAYTKDDKDEEKRVTNRVIWLRETLKRGGTHVELHDLKVRNPTDFGKLLPAMGKVAVAIKAHLTDVTAKFKAAGDNRKVMLRTLVCAGAPQMGATWIILANEGRLSGEFVQKSRGEVIKDEVTGERTRKHYGRFSSVPLSPFIEGQKILHAGKLLGKYIAFSAAAQAFGELARTTHSGARAQYFESLERICVILQHWETNYDSAHRLLREHEATVRIVLDSVAPDCVERMKEVLGKLVSVRGDAAELALDRLCRASCQFAQGRFSDCVLTCWIAYEALVLETLKGLVVLNADRGTIANKEDRLMGNDKHVYDSDGNVKFAAPGASQPHGGMVQLKSNKLLHGALQMVKNARDDYVHHGTAVSKTDAAAHLKTTETAVLCFLSWPVTSLDEMPFTPKLLQSLEAAVRDLRQIS